MSEIDEFRAEIGQELDRIVNFWKQNSVDYQHGGFVGQMDTQGYLYQKADKGLVLNARILWTFSAVYNFNQDNGALQLAHRAYAYLRETFYDEAQGGMYWSVSFEGKPRNTRNQVYGLAFVIYALSEYYRATQKAEALLWAIELFETIEKHAFDPQNGGYFEAFTQEWHKIEDLRLSDKDRNDPKTNNTHLHLLEGYSNLYAVWKNDTLAQKIEHLLEIYETKIINPNTHHCGLFFSEDWQLQSQQISFGHDIEASWLLQNCAMVLENDTLNQKFAAWAVKLADATTRGFAPDGSLYHEYDARNQQLDTHREWWVSAEAMVGYFNVYAQTHQRVYWQYVQQLWNFTKTHLIDYARGEWFWGVYDDYTLMSNEDKIGFWKCPYHNTRSCIEIQKIVSGISSHKQSV